MQSFMCTGYDSQVAKRMAEASGSSKRWLKRCVRIAVATTLSVVLCGVVVIFLLIHLAPESFGSRDIYVSQVDNQQSCHPETYTGDVCKEALQMYQQCLGEGSNSSEIHVPLRKDQQEFAEEEVLSVISVAELATSQKCFEALVPFICYYYFGLCGSNGQVHLPSSELCEIIRDEICARDLENIGMFIELQPVCHLLPNITVFSECNGNVVGVRPATTNNTNSNLTGNCTEGFYGDEGTGVCRPQCGKWKFYSDNAEIAINIAVIISAAIGTIAGAIGLVLSCIQYKQIFKFPSVIVVYETISILLYEAGLLIGRTDPTALFCSSNDLEESFIILAPYCTVSGAIHSYTGLQIAIWWFIHVAVAFWAITFPLHYRSFQVTGRIKILHLFTVLIGVLLPLVSVGIAIGTGGYIPTYRLPPITCLVSNEDASFYSHTLLIAILFGAGSVLLVFIFLQLLKEHITKESKRERIVATTKVLINICYFAGIITYLVIILAVNKHQFPLDRYIQDIREYFLCESAGVRSVTMCDRSEINQVLPYQLLLDTLFILLALFPVVNLVYMVNIRELKQTFKKKRQVTVHSSKSTYFHST